MTEKRSSDAPSSPAELAGAGGLPFVRMFAKQGVCAMRLPTEPSCAPSVKETSVAPKILEHFHEAAQYTVRLPAEAVGEQAASVSVCLRGDGGTDFVETQGGKMIRAWTVTASGLPVQTFPKPA